MAYSIYPQNSYFAAADYFVFWTGNEEGKRLGNHLCLHWFWKIWFSRAVLEFDAVTNFQSIKEKYVGDGHNYKTWRQTTYLGCREGPQL